MAYNSWNTVLVAQQGNGGAVANTTTPTSLLLGQAKFLLPANYLAVGSRLRLLAAGIISNIVTTPGTLTFSFRLGAGGAVVACTSDALNLNIIAKTNVNWELEMLMQANAIGSGTSANLTMRGKWMSESVIASPVAATAGTTVAPLKAAGPASGTGFDSTAAQVCDLYATWSIANAGNSIQCLDYSLESMN